MLLGVLGAVLGASLSGRREHTHISGVINEDQNQRYSKPVTMVFDDRSKLMLVSITENATNVS